MFQRSVRMIILTALATIALGGCALRPSGEKEERERAAIAGRAFAEAAEAPALPDSPTADDFLRRAFYANANLRMKYWEWRSAIERIPQDSSFPNVAVPFSFLFGQNLKFWDRTTLGLANDPMTNIPFPSKLSTAGRRDLEQARASGLRFESAKFQLQGKVLTTYYDLALLGEMIRLQQENIDLVRLVTRQSAERVAAGSATQLDLLSSQNMLELAQNDLENLRAKEPPMAAKMNSLLGREANDPIPLPDALPAPRALPLADDQLIALGSERSPELAALARDVAGKKEALTLAKQAKLPDFALNGSVTGTISGTLGGMVILPTRIEAIRAGIEQAQADLRAAEEARTQYQRDLAASFVLNLYLLRNDERQAALYEEQIIPRARQMVKVAQTAYASGKLTYADLLEAERTLLNARLVAAQLRIEREKALAAIETWSAVDVEAMGAGGGK